MTDPEDPSKLQPTDWDRYYRQPAVLTPITRRATAFLLLRLITNACGSISPVHILELGGANSCFLMRMCDRFRPRRYTVVDSNGLGLKLLRDSVERDPPRQTEVAICQQDLLLGSALVPGEEPHDVVYSVGLIEHFDRAGTRQIIERHFEAAKPGGVVLITFPTPTLSYRMIRGLAERLGLWGFPDERPLLFEEVLASCQAHGTILHQGYNWAGGLTQGVLMVRKHPDQ